MTRRKHESSVIYEPVVGADPYSWKVLMFRLLYSRMYWCALKLWSTQYVVFCCLSILEVKYIQNVSCGFRTDLHFSN